MEHESRGRCFAAWFPLAACVCLAWPIAATAHGQGYAFVWAYDPTAPGYTPNPLYAYNDSGTPARVTRTGTGLYTVRFPGLRELIDENILTSEGNFQVSAYGGDASWCKIAGSSGNAVDVACFDAGGSPTDTYFDVLTLIPEDHPQLPGEDHGAFAYALADWPLSSSYTPDNDHAFNPADEPGTHDSITVDRTGPGVYAITWPGFSAIGSGGDTDCNHGGEGPGGDAHRAAAERHAASGPPGARADGDAHAPVRRSRKDPHPTSTARRNRERAVPEAEVEGVSVGTDCDDLHANANPHASEVCDSLDNNCDGQIDEGATLPRFLDADGDGHGDPARRLDVCPWDITVVNRRAHETGGVWLVELGNDCDDRDPDRWRGC